MADSDSDSHASSFDEEDDQDWGDWVEDNGEGAELRIASSSSGDTARTVYHALFCDPESAGSLRAFASADEAIDHAAGLGCDLLGTIRRCKLDTLQTIRLINHVRRQAGNASKRPDPVAYNALTGDEPFLHDDAELVPVPGYENDGLLQTDFDEMSAPGDDGNVSQSRRVAELESQLHASQLAFDDLRRRFMNDSDLGESLRATKTAMGSREKTDVGAGNTGEDSHYFTSYASHDIHQTMISDKVRTLSYAEFLLSPENAHLIRGKTIMDVGCGSGILSLFAARAGAKKVVAIDASDVASRAKENVRANGLESVITVYKGKVEELGEELSEYKGKVDVIVSEWMGYFLLYESMLPSVLYARDEYLCKGGLLAPSHTRMLLAAVADCNVVSQRLQFWDSVHGFSMQAMKTGLVDEAWTDTFQPDQVVSSVGTLFELPLQTMTAKQPSFDAPFVLEASKACSIQAFVSWFDTWFTPDGLPVPPMGNGDMQGGQTLQGLPPVTTRCPEEKAIAGLQLQGDAILEKASDTNTGRTVSFTTGPQGLETHWKQTLFVLKEPIDVEKGCLIVGNLRSTPNETNKREVDVEIHYSIRTPDAHANACTGTAKKSVETRTVQLFAVR